MLSEHILANSTGRVDLITEDKERNPAQFFNGKERIKLGLGFGKALKVGTVDEEDDSIYFREVVAP
jgi:hypothetical protein